MGRKEKLGDRGGVAEWRALATPGDVRRFIAWVIHSVRNQTLDRATAGVFSQLAMGLLKASAECDVEGRLRALEAAQHQPAQEAREEAQVVSES
jgi:hypothetical protein